MELMAEMALKAAVAISDPLRLGFLALGVFIGLILGVIPGLGGLVGLSLLLPFTFSMDPITALAFLMGLSSVSATSDTIPAILFGVPGTVASAATILDGFPMARRGEAGRAFGAAFTASVMGGVFGAILLGVSIPVLRPIMLAIASPELLAICIFGLSLAAVLAGGSPMKGLVAVCIGLIFAGAGEDPGGTLRWTFDTLYLYDGFRIVPIALGLFAIPEIADMVIQRSAIQVSGETKISRRDQWRGVKDAFRHWFLVLRCSFIGAGLGAVPGIGAPILDWVAYGHAARTEKGAAETFGKGDVRGVIASEASNNAKEGGSLVPTIAFGVPGTASMALILGAFIIHGLVPGPDMLSKNLDVTYTLVWSIAIANILGAGICFMFANQFAKVAVIRIGILAPVVLAIVFLGAFQGKHAWGDLYTLLGFGILGFGMKRLRWPRPPLLLGFVLGGLIENYLFISANVYGWAWLYRPVTLGILLVTAFGILRPIISYYMSRKGGAAPRVPFTIRFQPRKLDTDVLLAGIALLLFLGAMWASLEWEFRSYLFPRSIGTVGAVLAVTLIAVHLFLPAQYIQALKGRTTRDRVQSERGVGEKEEDAVQHFDLVTDFGDLDRATILRRAIIYFGWCVGYFAVAYVIGLFPTMALFLIAYIRTQGHESWTMTLLVSAGTCIAAYILFHQVLHVPWPQSVIGDLYPVLRTNPYLNFF